MKHRKKIYLAVGSIVVLILLAVALDLVFRRSAKPAFAPPPPQNTSAPEKKLPPTKPAEQDKTVVFECAGGKTIRATFHLPADKSVSLVLSDGRKLEVPHAVSADGARYATADESFVFWNVGDTAFIQEKGVTTYADCALETNPSPDK